ncbi:MAG: DUF373 family protein [Thermoplasmatota archaeon]
MVPAPTQDSRPFQPAARAGLILVLCVDRDNDLGRKAGVTSPIIGRQANIDAATALSLADPEDSDSNSVFGAVAAYDELRRDGIEAEVVTLCGHERVGSTSDRKISDQFEQVLASIRPERCIFVTDGAEDEFVLPIVASRLRVDAVRRIIVKQNADIEGTYYVIKKALEDDKIQRTIFIPLALGLLVYGIFALLGDSEKGVGAITLVVGLYFLSKALHIGAAAARLLVDFYSGLTAGRVSLFTSMLALLSIAGGVLLAVRAALQDTTSQRWEIVLLEAVIGTQLLWWLIFASFLTIAGKVLDAWVRERQILWSYWMLPFSLVAAGLILTAGLALGLAVVEDRDLVSALFEMGPILGLPNLALILGGFLVAIVGGFSNGVVRDRAASRPVPKAIDRDRAMPIAPTGER